LVDRDLALYDSQVIMEYLDERYPHPPLMPVDPVARARSRIYLYRIERDWYSQLEPLESGNGARREEAKKTLRDSLTVIAPIFEQKPFFMSDEFSMVDCCVAPILWRLKHYDIDLPAQAKSIQKYAERLFTRDSFQASLTDAEREMHRI
jgi:RNA polymerase-associated protein